MDEILNDKKLLKMLEKGKKDIALNSKPICSKNVILKLVEY